MGDVGKKSLGPAPGPVAVLRAHKTTVNDVAFHSSNLLLSGSMDGELRLWDVSRRRTICSSRAHNSVLGISTSDLLEDKVLSQGRDGTIMCWQMLETGLSSEPLITFKTSMYHFCKISPLVLATAPGVSEVGHEQENQDSTPELGLPAGKRLIAVSGEDSTAEVWDIQTGERVVQLNHPKKAGMCMAVQLFISPGSYETPNILVGYEDGSISMWDLRSLKSPRFSAQLHSAPILCATLDSSCTGGLSGSVDNKAFSFKVDLNKDAFVSTKAIHDGRTGVATLSVRSDNKIAALGGWDTRIRIFDYRRLRPLAVLKHHKDSITGVCFSKDSKLLASCSADCHIALWSIYS